MLVPTEKADFRRLDLKDGIHCRYRGMLRCQMIFTVLTSFETSAAFLIRLSKKKYHKKRRQRRGFISFNIINIRDFADDVHKTVMMRSYGGGPGWP